MDLLEKVNTKLDMILSIQSESLTVDALSILTGWTKNHIYKMTSKNVIPYYRPNGKTIFFKKQEIEDWLLSNRQNTIAEIDAKANRMVHFPESKIRR